jgi:hypothetical protein
MTICCAQPCSTRFCPTCGREVLPSPGRRLLSYAVKQILMRERQLADLWESAGQEHDAEYSQRLERRIASQEETIRRWKEWKQWLERVVAREDGSA